MFSYDGSFSSTRMRSLCVFFSEHSQFNHCGCIWNQRGQHYSSWSSKLRFSSAEEMDDISNPATDVEDARRFGCQTVDTGQRAWWLEYATKSNDRSFSYRRNFYCAFDWMKKIAKELAIHDRQKQSSNSNHVHTQRRGYQRLPYIERHWHEHGLHYSTQWLSFPALVLLDTCRADRRHNKRDNDFLTSSTGDRGVLSTATPAALIETRSKHNGRSADVMYAQKINNICAWTCPTSASRARHR